MALVIENGEGGDAFIDLTYFQEYCDDHGYDLSDFDDTKQEQAIRAASTYISAGFDWPGLKYGGRAQVLAWPRSDVTDSEGWPVSYLTIPREVEMATAEAAFFLLQNPGALNPVVSLTGRVISETVGPISTTYANPGMEISADRPVLVIINDLLKPLLWNNGGSSVTARADRG